MRRVLIVPSMRTVINSPGTETESPGHMYYTEIADILEARIHRGDYPKGSKLPTGTELGTEFEVSHQTIAKAMALLRERDLVVSRPPRGVFVK